jgi:hypothetical protein
MNGVKILERIVDEDGSCTWATPSICAQCPLGQLVRSDNGKYMSCVEALSIDGLSEEEADLKYKTAAIDKLIDITLNNAIETD